MNRTLKASLCVSWLAGCLTAASASIPALGLDTSTMFRSDFLDRTNGMYGWTFQVMEPITVTALAWYDEGQNGLFQGHEIGLWWASSSLPLTNYLVTSISIPSGTLAELNGIYRKVDLASPITLGTGRHIIGGTYSFPSEDQVAFGVAQNYQDWTQDSRIALGQPAWAYGDGFRMPDHSFLAYGLNVGPMLYIEPIPEPSPVALALIGFFCCIGHRVLRIRRSTVY